MEPILKLNTAERRLDNLVQSVDIINMRVKWIEDKLIKANVQTYYAKAVEGKGLLRWDAENDDVQFRLSFDEQPLVDQDTETKVMCLEALAAMVEEICVEGEAFVKRMHQIEGQ